MASKALQQLTLHGLGKPIIVRPGILEWAFVLLGGPFLIGGAIVALKDGGALNTAAGLVGVLLFGPAFLWLASLLVRSAIKGTLRFSESGFYHGQYGLEFDWNDIGPAWIYSLEAGGRKHKDVLFLLRNKSKYKPQMGVFGRWSFSIMEWQAGSRKGGALETSVPVMGLLLTQDQADISDALETMRQSVANEPDAVPLGIPRIIRFSVPNEDIVAIINTIVMSRHPSGRLP
jgi:hypothetical protein